MCKKYLFILIFKPKMPSNGMTLEGEKDIDIVHSILTGSPFKLRPENEKLTILKKGRPLFNLNIIKRDASRNCSRTFHSSWYTIYKWLCGSENYNKLFCWPCLLMRPETSSWCSIGNDDMKRFTSIAIKHARCKSHVKAISEYDDTLTGFGLPAEFVDDLKFKCKQEDEASISDKTEADDDSENVYFQETETERKEDTMESKPNCIVKSTTTNSNKSHSLANFGTKITFKTWQEMCRNNFPVSKSTFVEDFHLYKWKKKIAKQELKNARLEGEKLKFEIELLKAKIEYYNSLKQNVGRNESSVSTTASEALVS